MLHHVVTRFRRVFCLKIKSHNFIDGASKSNPITVSRKIHISSQFETLPAQLYSDDKIYQKERKEIFSKEWQLFCLQSQCSKPGDYVSMTVAGFPLLVIKDKANILQGFQNVCRHRANQLLPSDDTGHCDLLRCKYHGWVYDASDGNLKVAPGFGKEEINKSDFPLFKLKVETWRGLVFVNMDEKAAPLKNFLGRVADESSKFEMENYIYKTDLTRDIDCNWKTYIDNYQEGYHIPTIHPELNRMIDCKKYKVENEETNGRFSIHSAPTRQNPISGNEGLWLWMWPNCALNFYSWGMSVEKIIPLSRRKTRLHLNVFVRPSHIQNKEEADREEKKLIDDFLRFEHLVIEEDVQVCLNVQRNLEAGVYNTGILNPSQENGVHFFQKLVRNTLKL